MKWTLTKLPHDSIKKKLLSGDEIEARLVVPKICIYCIRDTILFVIFVLPHQIQLKQRFDELKKKNEI